MLVLASFDYYKEIKIKIDVSNKIGVEVIN